MKQVGVTVAQRLRDKVNLSNNSIDINLQKSINTRQQQQSNSLVQTTQKQPQFDSMSRNRNNKTTLEPQQQNGWQTGCSHKVFSLKNRQSAKQGNDSQWMARNDLVVANNNLISIQGIGSKQSAPSGGHGSRQYGIPRTRSIVVEKGSDMMLSNSPTLKNMTSNKNTLVF